MAYRIQDFTLVSSYMHMNYAHTHTHTHTHTHSYLVIMSECMHEVLKVVVVGFLQVLPHGSNDAPLPVLPTQVRARGPHVHQVSCSILVRLNEDPKRVVWTNIQCVLDPCNHIHNQFVPISSWFTKDGVCTDSFLDLYTCIYN